MPESPLRLIKRFTEFQTPERIKLIPKGCRGLYVLYRHNTACEKHRYDVVYVGMATGGIRGRLQKHRQKKAGLWTHFSAYEVWQNIRDEEIIELEGLFRHLYRLDSRANELNIQKTFKKAKQAMEDLEKWGRST